ncbi:MAG: tRNA epoxyqueuosine(34) reductase QueG [Opitutaceae bacterium]
MTTANREHLRSRLRALGFGVVRFASAADVPAGRFSEWLEAGHHAGMEWIARGREKRLDPNAIVEGTRSVVCLGVNYLPAGEAAAQQRWSKYALNEDYHETIGAALREAGRILERDHGLAREDYRAYVDTGPVLERGWAARAGLGWQGKNGMLISREHGNWLFLSVILTRLDVPPDPPLPALAEEPGQQVGHYCGSCTRCLAACPTDAFPEPGLIDARRCIAYHTIENRGIIPRELRARFGGRVFGCDTCLDVCPWNKFARASRSTLVIAREAIAGLTLTDLLTMSEERFREVFRKTPIKRSKLAGLLRNACIAAGNWDDTDDWHFGGVTREGVVAAVLALCVHGSPIVRAHAVWAARRLLRSEESDTLADLRRQENDPVVKEEYDHGGSG